MFLISILLEANLTNKRPLIIGGGPHSRDKIETIDDYENYYYGINSSNHSEAVPKINVAGEFNASGFANRSSSVPTKEFINKLSQSFKKLIYLTFKR